MIDEGRAAMLATTLHNHRRTLADLDRQRADVERLISKLEAKLAEAQGGTNDAK